ncbi:MAG: PD-(D/E)XK nuclease family protein [Suipraeoptans sp.]
MGLTFVFGPAGSGKSFYLYNRIINESMKHPEKNYIVLVPEQFTLSTQRELVSRHPNKGIMNIDVLSFARLAYRVFEEVGVKELPMLDDEGKNLVLRKIAGDFDSDLVILKGKMRKQGYISEVKSVISEFTQYDISEESIDEIIDDLGENKRLYYKLKDLKTLYKGFKDYLSDKYITKEEVLDRLSQVIKNSDLLKHSTIVLDGYTGFTPVQNRVIEEMLKNCDEVFASALIDKNEDPYVYRHPYQLFGLTKQMVSSLVRIAEEAKITINEPVKLFDLPLPRFEDRETLSFLEANIFRNRPNTFENNIEGLRLISAASAKEEAYFVVGEIRKLVRISGLSYQDIGIVATNMDVYRDFLTSAMKSFEIPAFIDQKRDILSNPFIEFLRSFLGLFKEQFKYDAVFRFLKTGLVGFSDSEVELLENYCLGAGITKLKKWQEVWNRTVGDITKDELSVLNHLRVRFVELVEPYRMILKERQKTVYDITNVLYEFIVKEDIEKKLNFAAEELSVQNNLQLSFEYKHIYGVLIELLDKFVALLGDEVVGISEYIDLFDAGLLEAKVGVIPQGMSQVIAGDLTRTRFDEIKILFIMGASDDLLPGNLNSYGVLSQRDRSLFENKGYVLSPGAKEKAFTQKLYLYSHLTKPSKNVYVSYYRSAAFSKSVKPSYLVSEIKKLFKEIKEENVSSIPLWEREFTKELGVNYIIESLWKEDGKFPPEIEELLAFYKREDKESVDDIVSARYRENDIKNLSKRLASLLYGKDFKGSVTRIEKYSKCSYAHFLAYGLALREREEYEFEAIDLGNICHMSLERYAKKLYNKHIDWVKIDENSQKNIISDCVRETIEGYKNDLLFDTSKNKYMIDKIERLVDRSVWALTKQLEPGDFKPMYYEFGFKDGKIDRIDLCRDEDKIYVKVIDYKTGNEDLKITSLYHGLKLQLMIYLRAAKEAVREQFPGKDVIPAGALYFMVDDPVVEKQDSKEQLDIAKLKEMKLKGVVNADENALSHFEPMKDKFSTIPVSFTKDGKQNKYSRGFSREELETMMDFAMHKISESKKGILDGTISANPVSCDYCNYNDICGFDESIPGFEKKEIISMDDDILLSLMKGELESER